MMWIFLKMKVKLPLRMKSQKMINLFNLIKLNLNNTSHGMIGFGKKYLEIIKIN